MRELVYVLMTIYTRRDGTKITHAYGPYTEAQARHNRQRVLAASQPEDGKIEAHALLLMDPENRSPFVCVRPDSLQKI